jgi:hypothetical protein
VKVARVKDPLKWAAVACAVVVTAKGEYDLAMSVPGMHEWVAAAVPGALDAYVLRTLQRGREVIAAVGAMVGVNAASHLEHAGVIPMEWPLITAVSAIAPLVLWRVHVLGSEERVHKARRARRDRKDVHAPAPVPVSTPSTSTPDTLPDWLTESVHGPVIRDGHAGTPSTSTPSTEPAFDPVHAAEHAPDPGTRARPGVRARTAPVADSVHVAAVREHMESTGMTEVPTVRAIKSLRRVGTPVAQRVRDELKGVQAP